MDLIASHPVLEFSHGEKVSFSFDGRDMEGFEGEPIAMALHAGGVKVYRHTPEMKRPRGFFCAIGKCSSCFMVVDGVPNVRTCVTPLKRGMKVETQEGRGKVDLGAQGAF
ncbi:MAG: (2Fe-2S)-binding protein [Synergistaceae bacterium]|jgi:predicted molibdopterin-dependent oxidoreductase YjgC|nr:(2Fe-2S)-binding protein [Synergistaceae bacterium]